MRGFSEGAIELYGVMNFRESNMNNAVVEQLREIVGQRFEDMQEIVGGMDLLPNAFYENLKPYVRFGAEVTAIEQDPDSVTVHYKGPAGRHVGHRRLRDLHHPVLGPARHRGPGHAVLAARSSGRSASSTTTRRPRSCSRRGTGSGRRRTASSAARPSPTCRSGASATRRPTPTTSAACCSPATRGARTRCAGARWTRRRGRAGARGRRPDPPADHDGVRGRRLARLVQRPVRERRLRAVRAGAADAAAGRHRQRPRAGSTSPASTARCTTRGSRARSSRGSGRRTRSTRHRPRPLSRPAQI